MINHPDLREERLIAMHKIDVIISAIRGV